MVRSHRERVDDINNAIKDIYFSEDALEKAEQSKDEATANLCFQAILYNLIIIGESVKNLDKPLSGLAEVLST